MDNNIDTKFNLTSLDERNAQVQREHLVSLRPPAKTGNAHYDPEIEQSKLNWVGKQLLCLAKHGTPIGGSCKKQE
jgi:hypothetical protein